jgi:hypothetical protein
MLSSYEKQELFKTFPANIELSYDTPIHKKVFDYFIAIPEGPKCFIWFTVFKSKNICAILEIDQHKRIKGIQIVQACFHNHLSYGTILYGTKFSYNRCSVEDIFYYKGRLVPKTTVFAKKLEIYKTLFHSELRQVSYTKSHYIFGLPFITDSSTKITTSELCYKVKEIHMRGSSDYQYTLYTVGNEQTHLLNKRDNSNSKNNNNTGLNNKNSKNVFRVKADLQTDIYHIYDGEKYLGIAHIPSYQLSVLMNSLFRNIRENRNLDLLEESDDEEEFENDNLDKFVSLEKEYKMTCTYNHKFKKWVPQQVII